MNGLNGTRYAGFGVAGNFAGHLEQAGEARDFASLKASGTGPKGMFPFHLPIAGHFLATDPISDSVLTLPEGGEVQGEPEVSLVCDVAYRGAVADLRPVAFAAFDDASIRREGAPKISVKKNWGPGSKGMSSRWIPLADGIVAGCPLDGYRIASFLKRDGIWQAYGVDSPVLGYSLYGPALLEWIDDRLSGQRDEGPLEDLPVLLEKAGRPERIVVTIGATRYTALGETTYLKVGDLFAVAVYDPTKVDASSLTSLADSRGEADGLSLLVREVRAV